mgnify:CR=1 FL=1
MRALLLAAAVVAASPGLLGLAAAEARAAGCVTSADCNMNGLCTGGACRCDPWWSGPRCSALRLGPAKPNSGYRTTSGAQGYSWGGSVVAGGDNTFHLIASEWTQRCGLEYWTPNSRLIRATSRHVDGPYVFAAEVLPTFYTNPQITAAPGGRLLLFAIGQECNRTADCANASHPPGRPLPLHLPLPQRHAVRDLALLEHQRPHRPVACARNGAERLRVCEWRRVQ